MTLKEFSQYGKNRQKEELLKCCGSQKWTEKMVAGFPYDSLDSMKAFSDQVWFSLNENDWRESFTHHPKIGDMDGLKKKFASTASWAGHEQAGVSSATENILHDLKSGNDQYEKKFGYIFIVCATGKTAAEMLSMLQARLNNTPEQEIMVAMKEQNKITHLRLDKLFS